jgi:putative peptide zinc metalloprotease protein
MPSNNSRCAAVVAVRRRVDLVVRKQQQRRQTIYVVKDPLANRYFRFSEVEFTILQMLERSVAIDEIVARISAGFPNVRLCDVEVRQFVQSLYAKGLVVGQSWEEGARLLDRRNLLRQSQLRHRLTSLLAIRCHGVDPTWLLDVLAPLTNWFFAPMAVVGVAIAASLALVSVLLRVDSLRHEILAMHEFFGPGNWLLLALTLALTKMLHELGHALTCRRFGGEVHAIGVMFLVFTPCLYCDVSDSWLLPSKWQRAAIAAAGMYVEVALACLATFVWVNSAPGTLHFLSLQVMLVCSISTVLFNGNPLARYDGYFILADFVEIPNLRDVARAALAARLWSILGIQRQGASDENHVGLALFGMGVTLYRWALIITILWVLHHLLAPRGLDVLWQGIALTVMFGVVINPSWRLLRELQKPEAIVMVNRWRFCAIAGLFGCSLAAFFFLPLERCVVCTFETRFADSAVVYAPYRASLKCVHVAPGDSVSQGDILVELRNHELELEIERLKGEVKSAELQQLALQYQRYRDSQSIELQDAVREALAASRAKLVERSAERNRLRLSAPRDGFVLPARRRLSPQHSATLASWSGTLLDQRNQSAPLMQGDIICEIGDPQRLDAALIVDQAFIKQVRRGATVELVLDAKPLHKFRGTITEIALDKLAETPEGLSVQAGGQLVSRIDDTGVERPANPSYMAIVPLPSGVAATAGLRGSARIHAGRETLASRTWQYCRHTFQFNW